MTELIKAIDALKSVSWALDVIKEIICLWKFQAVCVLMGVCCIAICVSVVCVITKPKL